MLNLNTTTALNPNLEGIATASKFFGQDRFSMDAEEDRESNEDSDEDSQCFGNTLESSYYTTTGLIYLINYFNL